MTHEDLCAEFPRWKCDDSGRWAVRDDRPTTAQIKAGCKLWVGGNDAAQLREQLVAEEKRLAAVG